MEWKEAYKLLKAGEKIKLPSWGGYWCWDNEKETIIMCTKENEELDIRETQRVDYTFSNIASDKWIVATNENTPTLGGEALFDFTEAWKYIKRGLKLCRKGWNVKGYVELADKSINSDSCILSICEFVNYVDLSDNELSVKIPFMPSQIDIIEEDWMFYEE